MFVYHVLSFIWVFLLRLTARWASLWAFVRRDPNRGALAMMRRDRAGYSAPRDQTLTGGARIWLHAASVAQLRLARGFVLAALARDEKLDFIITANTAKGLAEVRGWGLARVEARFAPYDRRLCVDRFLDRWDVNALISVEADIWPIRHAAAAKRGIAVIILGAHVSHPLAKMMLRWPGVRQNIMAALSYVVPMDAETQSEFLRLGLARDKVHSGVDLRAGLGIPAPDASELAALQPSFQRDTTMLAIAPQGAEITDVLSSYTDAQSAVPDLKLMVVTTSKRQSKALKSAAQARGIPLAQHGQDRPPKSAPAIYVSNTGEDIPLFCTLAGFGFLGGSMVKKGGTSPRAAVQFGMAILQGPDVGRHAAYAALRQSPHLAMITVEDQAALRRAVMALSQNPRAALAMARMAQGALARTTEIGDKFDRIWPPLARISGIATLLSLPFYDPHL